MTEETKNRKGIWWPTPAQHADNQPQKTYRCRGCGHENTPIQFVYGPWPDEEGVMENVVPGLRCGRTREGTHMKLDEGRMILDNNQPITEAEIVARLLEAGAVKGPNMAQVRALAMEWRQPQAWSVALLVMN